MLTGGQIADCTAGTALIEKLPACEILRRKLRTIAKQAWYRIIGDTPS